MFCFVGVHYTFVTCRKVNYVSTLGMDVTRFTRGQKGQITIVALSHFQTKGFFTAVNVSTVNTVLKCDMAYYSVFVSVHYTHHVNI